MEFHTIFVSYYGNSMKRLKNKRVRILQIILVINVYVRTHMHRISQKMQREYNLLSADYVPAAYRNTTTVNYRKKADEAEQLLL